MQFNGLWICNFLYQEADFKPAMMLFSLNFRTNLVFPIPTTYLFKMIKKYMMCQENGSVQK